MYYQSTIDTLTTGRERRTHASVDIEPSIKRQNMKHADFNQYIFYDST